MLSHYIIVKFKPEYDWKTNLPAIRELFDHAREIKGVDAVYYHETCSDRPNRAHLAIEMVLTEEALKEYDNSWFHKKWKEDYGNTIEQKTIFDTAVDQRSKLNYD